MSFPDVQLNKFTIPTFFGSPVKDPFDLYDGAGHQTVEFYDYRRPIPMSLTMRVLQLANAEAISHHDGGVIGTERHLEYWVDEVQLLLIPTEETTWRMWFGAVLAMARFAWAARGMSYEWSFILLADGESVSRRRRLDSATICRFTSLQAAECSSRQRRLPRRWTSER